jgi:(E)-4-hydroxy-3-methylbut-2-enyl-diphosphate synthase
VVNGPGEAREAHIGLAGGSPNLLYVDGKPSHKVKEEDLVDELERQVRAKIAALKEQPQAERKAIPIKAVG